MRAIAMADHGLRFGKPEIDLRQVRGWKEKVVGKLTGGPTAMAEHARLKSCAASAVPRPIISKCRYKRRGPGSHGARKWSASTRPSCRGSQAMKLPFVPDDPRVVDSTGALALTSIPDARCW